MRIEDEPRPLDPALEVSVYRIVQEALTNVRRHAHATRVRMPGLDGIAATRQITAGPGGPKVIILTTFDLDGYVYDALRAGASGFLLKSSPPERLITAIRTVAEGDALLDPAITHHVIDHFARPPPRPVAPPDPCHRLTDRELDVLRQLARGLSNAEIASELVVSEATVKTHIARMLAKLQLRERVQAVVYAYRHGLTGDQSP